MIDMAPTVVRSPRVRALTSLLVLAAACATAPLQPPYARRYDASPPQSLAVIREALEKRGIYLKPTDDPNVLVSDPISGQTPIFHEYSRDQFQLSGPEMRSRDLNRWRDDAHAVKQEAKPDLNTVNNFGAALKYGSEDTDHEILFRVTVKEAEGGGSVVLVERSDRFGWANSAEYNSIGPWAPVLPHGQKEKSKLEARGPPPYRRDPEMEAVVAQVLDGQVDLQINDGAPPVASVLPLPTPAKVENAERFSQPTTPCSMRAEKLTPMVAAGHVLMLSDPMGANESWLGIKAVLCLAERGALPVTLAIGMPRTEQRAINEYLESQGTEADRAALLSTPFWNREWQDGRSSKATLEMVEYVRQRRQAGARVTLLAYEPNAMTGNVRQASIASLLLRHRESDLSQVLVFVHGNVAVSKVEGTEWDKEFLSVGARLNAVLAEKTHAFDIAYDPGDHWTCRGDNGSIRCGTWMAKPGPAQKRRLRMVEPTFELFVQTSVDGFDGVVYVGPLTTSVPALASKFKDQGNPR